MEFSSLGMQSNFSPMNVMGVGLGVANIGSVLNMNRGDQQTQNIFGSASDQNNDK